MDRLAALEAREAENRERLHALERDVLRIETTRLMGSLTAKGTGGNISNRIIDRLRALHDGNNPTPTRAETETA